MSLRRPKPATARDFRTYIRRFTEVNGNLAVDEITKAHLVVFKDAMLKMPRRLTTELQRLSVPDIIARTSSDLSLARVSATTVNDKDLAAIRVVTGFAKANALITINPVEGVKAIGPVKHVPARLPPTTAPPPQ